jgi:hypothetical protein
MRERKKSEGKERGEEKEEKKMRRRGVTSVCRKFLCQAAQSSGFLRPGKGPKLTKQKKLECFTCRVRHPGERLHTAQGSALVSVARGSLSLHQAF